MTAPGVPNTEKVLRTLARHQVKYVLIGALGAVLHGSPLRTDDVDICPDPDPGNLLRLAQALDELKAGEWETDVGEVVDRQWDAGLLGSGSLWTLVTDSGDLDLVFQPAGTGGYGDLITRADFVELDDLRIAAASLDDIIEMKQAARRPQDLEQLRTLKHLRHLKRRDDSSFGETRDE